MGFDFAQHLHDYVYLVAKEPTLLGHRGNIARIKPNPERSKHLETATVQICGLEVDFVNLRNEVYTAGSRIPVVVGGGVCECEREACAKRACLFVVTHYLRDNILYVTSFST